MAIVSLSCSVAGLACDIIGAIILVRGLLALTKEQATELGLFRIAADDPEENFRSNPLTRNLWAQHREAWFALAFLVAGFVLQMLGSIFGFLAR